MSEVIRFTLRGDVSWVNADIYPDAGGCNILCLTNRQVSIIRQMVYPHALSPARFVSPIFDRWFTYADGALLAEHVDEVDDLLDKLGTEGSMNCQAILDALDLIALHQVPSATVDVAYFNSTLPAGGQTPTIYTVPAQKVVHVQSMTYMYAGTAPGTLAMAIVSGGVTAWVMVNKPPVSGTYYTWNGGITLIAGDSVRANIYNATLNDDLTFFIVGTVMDLAL